MQFLLIDHCVRQCVINIVIIIIIIIIITIMIIIIIIIIIIFVFIFIIISSYEKKLFVSLTMGLACFS